MTDTNGSDLVCKAHNGSLSSQEQRQLDRLLQSSPEVRLMNQIVGQLDRESVVQPGDEGVVRAIAERAASRRRSPGALGSQRAPRRWRPLLAAALVFGLTGVAAAAFWGKRRGSLDATSAHASSQRALATASERSVAPNPNVAPGSATLDAPRVAGTDGRVAGTDGRAANMDAPRSGRLDAPRVAGTDASPAVGELFAEANRCRRQGESERARAIYRRIIDVSSKSREAMLSRLALAKMEEVTRPQVALQLYQALAKQVSEVRPEALWGTAEVARRLGQSRAERTALETLLHDFPNTAYARAAQQRLQDAER
jgi:hypothetical protein